ncbi:MAG TPA: hypothetical protein PLE75_00285 [Ferruginibacter sp.]|nr:hypothetical protein [Ferruginibacter sp.]HRO05091.1 hypothetical protein [Ferruginibacter sp.]HRO95604.1 hypothetical protein [Ferruginibacter sp.]HRP49537.1 hypothetical protein [Ferruginibacter sp.]
MKFLFYSLMVLLFPFTLKGQKLTFAEVLTDDRAEMNFEILGKQGNRYVIYKEWRNKHYLTFYNAAMEVDEHIRIKELPDKTRGVDFISYPDKILMVYQFNDGKSFECAALEISNDGKVSADPVPLDAARVSSSSGDQIFSVFATEDKQKILIYKMLRSGDSLTLTTRVFDAGLNLQDIGVFKFSYNKDKESFSDVAMSNDGHLAMAKQTSRTRKERASAMDLMVFKKGMDTFQIYPAVLDGAYLDDVVIKTDNLNKRFVFNSLFSTEPRTLIAGLYNAAVPFDTSLPPLEALNSFPDSLRSRFNTGGSSQKAFEDLVMKQVVIKKDGGWLITAEENLTIRTGRRYDRYDYMFSNPYRYDYYNYMYNPAFSRPFYRGYPGFYDPSLRNEFEYQSNNILMISYDPQLKANWDAVIPKRQNEYNTDQSVSFGVMNSGGMFHFLYGLRDRNSLSIGHTAVTPNGEINRFAPVQNRQRNYDFMPRYAKQVSYAGVIVPYQYNTRVGFALLEF